MSPSEEEHAPSVAMQALLDSHERFLRFLERRLASREAARDVLQGAYLAGLEKEDTLRDAERVVPWFYRLLRNAVVDHYRHLGVERSALRRFGFEQTGPGQLEPEIEGQICACVSDLIPELRPEYAELLREIDLGEEEIATVAEKLGITPNNARVRLFRARRALQKALISSCGVCAEHSCLDCSCRARG